MGGAPTLKTKSVKFNFMMNMILTVSSFVFPLITFPYVSRVLLVEGNGYVSFATSVLTYFTMFASLGIPSYGSRYHAICELWGRIADYWYMGQSSYIWRPVQSRNL